MPELPTAEARARCAAGWRHLEQGDARAAAAFFTELIALQSESGEGPQQLLPEAVAGLAECLPALDEEPEARRQALLAVCQAWAVDVSRGADGVAKEASFMLLRHALADERVEVAAWVRRTLAACRDRAAAEQHWRLLLDLEALDPATLDAVFDRCRDAGHARLVAEKLLDLDRVGEALMLARTELQAPEEMLSFAESPAAHGQARAVMALVEERLAAAFEPCLATWLADRHAERGDLTRALDIHLRLLRVAPRQANLQALEDLARRLGRWEQLRPQVERARMKAA